MLCIEIHRSPFTIKHNWAEECIANIEDKTEKLSGKMEKATGEWRLCSLGHIGKIFLELGWRCMSVI